MDFGMTCSQRRGHQPTVTAPAVREAQLPHMGCRGSVAAVQPQMPAFLFSVAW